MPDSMFSKLVNDTGPEASAALRSMAAQGPNDEDFEEIDMEENLKHNKEEDSFKLPEAALMPEIRKVPSNASPRSPRPLCDEGLSPTLSPTSSFISAHKDEHLSHRSSLEERDIAELSQSVPRVSMSSPLQQAVFEDLHKLGPNQRNSIISKSQGPRSNSMGHQAGP